MSHRFAAVCTSLVLLAACAPEQPESSERVDRSERSEHEVVAGHCSVAACGGQSTTDACWCDDLCAQYNDCCADKTFFCPGLGEQCGGFAGNPCVEGSCADDPSDTCDPNNGGADCPGVCQEEQPCATDDDCADGWCRPMQDGGTECAPWAQEDQACAGHVPAWNFEKCAPGLVCYQTGAGAYDIPGLCRPFCGGIGAIQCASDTHCVLDGDYPDAGGHCEQSPADSCQGQCGGQSEDGSCWCDSLCASYGDCCTDYAPVCT